MDIDFRTWGPLTVLAVASVLLLIVGGLVEVVTTNYTFSMFLNDLRLVAALLGGGTALARGVRLHGTTVTRRRPR
jgi:hypothetical protein